MARVLPIMMNVEILDHHNPRWLEVLKNLRHDIYHLPTYFEIEANRSNTKPEAIVITENGNCLFVPYLLRDCHDILNPNQGNGFFDVLSPYGYPGFLLDTSAAGVADFANFALQEAKDVLKSRGVCTAFFRMHPILSDRFDQFFAPGTFVENGETVSINLNLSETDLWRHTRKGHQSTINRGKRLELVVRVVPFADHIDEFLSIYNETMDRVTASASYYFGYEYFDGLLQLGHQIHLGVVELDHQIICASLFFECDGIVQAHLGGTRDAFLPYSPFNLLLHQMRLWAKERGNKFLHLGGGVGGSKEDRLYIFKSGFSRQRHQFKTARFIIDAEKHQYLVHARAEFLGLPPHRLIESGFFPAYRAAPQPIECAVSAGVELKT
jgi:Acetyltransferase (GNAT) domain